MTSLSIQCTRGAMMTIAILGPLVPDEAYFKNAREAFGDIRELVNKRDCDEIMRRTGLPVTLAALYLLTQSDYQYAVPMYRIANYCGLCERDSLQSTSPSADLDDVYYWCAAHLSTAVLHHSQGRDIPASPELYKRTKWRLGWVDLEPTTQGRLTPWEVVIANILQAAESQDEDGDVIILNPVLLAEGDGLPYCWEAKRKRLFYSRFEKKCKKLGTVLHNSHMERLYAASSNDLYDELDMLVNDLLHDIDRRPVF